MLTLVFWIIAGNVTVLALMLAHWYRTEFKHHVDAESLPTRPELLLKSIESNHPIYYFGVGSNMLRSKVEGRSYDGSRIEIISFEPGFAPGYRLAFNSRTFPPLEPAMASIEPILPQDSSCWTQCGALHPNADNSCHGALVQLNPDQYAKLWRSEGGGTNAQTYEEIVVTVYPYYNVDDSNSNNKKEPVRAIALRVRQHNRLRQDMCPSVRYMTLLCQGAAELGLQEHYQQWLLDHPVQPVLSWMVHKLSLYNLVVYMMSRTILKRPSITRFLPWLLSAVYVPSTRPRPQRLLSNIATVYILIPGFLVGFVVRNYMHLAGIPPHPILKLLEQHKS